MTSAFIGLGANLGDASLAITQAMNALDHIEGTRLAAMSPLYRSAPVGYLDQPDFVNAVAMVKTTLSPHALLDALLTIEHEFGRERTFRNAPRTLDMDLLLYGEVTLHDERLTLPHPRMHERGFVMQPLHDLAPDLEIPGRGTVSQHLSRLDVGDLQILGNLQAEKVPDPFK